MEAEETARKQAEVRRWYEQKWHKFRPTFDRFLELFPKIQQLENDWRKDVFCGLEQFDEQMDQIVRGLSALWLTYSRMFKERAEFLGRNLPATVDDSLSVLGKIFPRM